jgi:GNAT superfamily N-acetyltransferase
LVMDDVTIRDARAGDGPGCARVWQDSALLFTSFDPEFFQMPDPDGLANWFEHLIAKPREGRLWLVADRVTEIVGSLGATLHEPLETGKRQVLRDFTRRTVYIDSLGVAQPFRRHGVGQALMIAAENWARARGAEVISLETELANPTAMPFYERTMDYQRQSVTFRKRL